MDSSTFFCVILPALLIVGFIALNSYNRSQAAKAREEAHARYKEAIQALRKDPTNPGKRQTALELGRAYSALTREGKGVTVFDEVALKNDLDAATAGAVSVAAPPAPAAPASLPATSVADRIRKLDELKTLGIITEDEYQARRAAIIAEL